MSIGALLTVLGMPRRLCDVEYSTLTVSPDDVDPAGIAAAVTEPRADAPVPGYVNGMLPQVLTLSTSLSST